MLNSHVADSLINNIILHRFVGNSFISQNCRCLEQPGKSTTSSIILAKDIPKVSQGYQNSCESPFK